MNLSGKEKIDDVTEVCFIASVGKIQKHRCFHIIRDDSMSKPEDDQRLVVGIDHFDEVDEGLIDHGSQAS